MEAWIIASLACLWVVVLGTLAVTAALVRRARQAPWAAGKMGMDSVLRCQTSRRARRPARTCA